MRYRVQNNELIVSIPFTLPTSKIRVKRPIQGQLASSVACRSDRVRQDDYLEWQISYDTDSLTDPSVVTNVVLRKPRGVRYGTELVRLIVEALRLNLLSPAKILELKNILATNEPGIEETEFILQQPQTANNSIGGRFGFSRYQLSTPGYIKSQNGYSVEIRISPKQKAVGTQAMIYLHLPANRCTSDEGLALVGRIAEKNESANYHINAGNAQLIFDTTLAFAIASNSHRDDIRMIFRELGL